MNLFHLKYAVEVEKTRSINKAAENLFMGQPNLSRAIKELEESLGIIIFKRTSKGITPTAKGEEFLEYARSILAQIHEVEELYSQSKGRQEFNISIPRSSYITQALCAFVGKLDLSKPIQINYRETNSLNAINNIVHSDYHLGIIRFQSAFEAYFDIMLNEKGLKAEKVWEFEHMIVMHKSSPLAAKEIITKEDLKSCIEIAHGDPFVPSLPNADIKKAELPDFIDKRVLVYERGSQFDLLADLPIAYMRVSPIPQRKLERYGLIQKICEDSRKKYKDVLIYRRNYRFSELDQRFIEELYRERDELAGRIIQ